MVKRTILFIHGMFSTPACWEHWLPIFRKLGYEVLAPAWPLHGGSVKALRSKHPDPRLGQLTLSEVVEHYTALIAKLKTCPILIGHSMGGLVVQLLMQRLAAKAVVAIDSAPPFGVLTSHWSFYRSNWPLIDPFVRADTPYVMPFKDFQYTFTNGLPLKEQTQLYERYHVPESRLVGRGPLNPKLSVNFKQPHPPLLFIAGGNDHIIPPTLNRSNFRRYQDRGSNTELKQFPGRAHFLIVQSGWQEIATSIATWLKAYKV